MNFASSSSSTALSWLSLFETAAESKSVYYAWSNSNPPSCMLSARSLDPATRAVPLLDVIKSLEILRCMLPSPSAPNPLVVSDYRWPSIKPTPQLCGLNYLHWGDKPILGVFNWVCVCWGILYFEFIETDNEIWGYWLVLCIWFITEWLLTEIVFKL